jgi:hypothetical protein
MLLLAAVPDVPAPLLLVDALHGLTFVLHTAAMNVMVALAFVLATARRDETDLQRTAAGLLPAAFSLTITLGVAPLLFLQLVHGERFYASSIQMAWPWIGVLFVLMAAYYAAYAAAGRLETGRPAARALRVLPLAGLLVFSFVLAANVSLSEHPEVLAAQPAPGWNLALGATNAPLRWAHEILGAVAVGSLALFVLGAMRRRTEAAGAAALERRGLAILLGATAVVVVLGIVQVLARPADVGGGRAGASLGVGVLLGLALPLLAWRHARRPGRRSLGLVLGVALLLLVAKTVLRMAIRARRLEAAGGVEPPAVHTDVGPIVLFGVGLVALVICLAWLVRVLGRAGAATPAPEAR